MKSSIGFLNIVVGAGLLCLSGLAVAGDAGSSRQLPTAAGVYAEQYRSADSAAFPSNYFLVDNGSAAGMQDADVNGAIAPYQPPLITGRKMHQYLGLGTVLFAGLTAMAAPEGCEHNCSTPVPRETSGTTHTRLARTTAVLAVATVVTGLIYHWDDFYAEDGWADPDNQHVLLAGTGAMMMLYAINKSAKSSVPTSHAGTAELGAVAMLAAIKLTW